MLPSRRHSLPLTRKTPTRSLSPTTTHEAATSAPINISGGIGLDRRRHHLYPGHLSPAVKALSPIPWGTRLFCSTGQLIPGTLSGWTEPAAVRAWADTSRPLPGVATSWTHYNCVHSGSRDDRESGWADNNPCPLPFYGRMYVPGTISIDGGGPVRPSYST